MSNDQSPAMKLPAGQGTQKKSIAPYFFFAGSFFCFAFWVACILIDIQASEALFGGPKVHSLMPNWILIQQPIQFITGNLEPNMVVPVLVGWIIEIFYLIFTFAHDLMHVSVLKYNRLLSGPFKTFCWAAVLYNGYSSFVAGFVSGGWGAQAIFALLVSAAVLFLGTAGITLFRMGQSEW